MIVATTTAVILRRTRAPRPCISSRRLQASVRRWVLSRLRVSRLRWGRRI